MALSRIDGQEELYVGGLWALRRSDSLTDRRITHVLSMVAFNLSSMKNFKDESWGTYGRDFEHLVIDIDDVDDADLLIELPRAVRFIDAGLRADQPDHLPKDDQGPAESGLGERLESLQMDENQNPKGRERGGGVFVHCAAGKSRSIAVAIAYLLWRFPNRFDPNIVGARRQSGDADASPPPPQDASPAPAPASLTRRETAKDAVRAALGFIRRTRPMADPNDGFMHQLELWWEMGCPADRDIETHPLYQRWAYRREVEENVAVGQAPSRLRFEDEESGTAGRADGGSGTSLRCKKCRRTLATSSFIIGHKPSGDGGTIQGPCPHFFIEPLGWMRRELEKGTLNGRLLCPNPRCGAAVGRYDWKGFKCSCGGWVTPGFSLQRARVDDLVARPSPASAPGGEAASQKSLGIRMPPGARCGNL
ncbi:Tyrosine-protein phosphatase-like protein [Hapsidospora chrysogenum ATCC 11550]|uniref:protein-tyrosine-phosphatase n=1 Tax=Hapsidospora chrysogenum (strain ATCC 11550 / CBS 779.69 / DSM 880 / IAM 14645 / JCM 23072 / IMI 49137) TaxID=857340 RepID=A0A086SUI5_HAPC1|nr:Tyrosine-protein phosphatase-like protein [Hapsidospora chrysogenum ATCC 11550]